MKNISIDFLVLDPVTPLSLKHRGLVQLENKRVKAVQGLKSFVDANLEAFL